jgi:LuxR family maltose regulon positive regulatory protein
LERAVLGGDVRARIAGYVNTARLSLTAGDIAAATEMLERAQALVEQAPFPEWTSRYQRCRIEYWLARGQLGAAVGWAEAALRDGALPEGSDGEPAQLALGRILIAKGDAESRERVLPLLERVLQTAEDEGRAGVQIEALALRALALWASGDGPGALTTLERALRLAEPHRYVRLFADLGLPMARLLQEAGTRGVMPDYVASLLAACGADLVGAAGGQAPMPEPLSPRERAVLDRLAAGLTNREIAEQFFVSPETIKKHIASIFGKLGARHRAEAVAKARTLGLLD